MLHRARRPLLGALLLVLAFASSGCDRAPEVAVVSQGGTYTLEQAETLARDVDITALAETEASDGPEIRREVLIGLRRTPSGEEVADLLTSEFPEVTRAVPLYVESAVVDGREAWVVVEAWGSDGGKLDHKRLWVLDAADGEVLAVRSP